MQVDGHEKESNIMYTVWNIRELQVEKLENKIDCVSKNNFVLLSQNIEENVNRK